jgi:hypothetical protein
LCDFGNLSIWQRREYPTASVIPRLANTIAVICALVVFAIDRKLLQQTAGVTLPLFHRRANTKTRKKEKKTTSSEN